MEKRKFNVYLDGSSACIEKYGMGKSMWKRYATWSLRCTDNRSAKAFVRLLCQEAKRTLQMRGCLRKMTYGHTGTNKRMLKL